MKMKFKKKTKEDKVREIKKKVKKEAGKEIESVQAKIERLSELKKSMKKEAQVKLVQKIKRATTKPKQSLEVQIRQVQSQIDKIINLKKKESLPEGLEKGADFQLKILNSKLNLLVKSRLSDANKNIRGYKTSENEIKRLDVAVKRDLALLSKKLKVTGYHFEGLKREKRKVFANQKHLKVSLEKIDKKLSSELKVRRELKSKLL